jgi:hypothetical protein
MRLFVLSTSIIDITKDPPPYRASDFDNSHITYIKLSTVSKIPPSRDDIRRFIQVAKEAWNKKPDKQIAVHCHYGYELNYEKVLTNEFLFFNTF